MKFEKPFFYINKYDSDGDITEKGIFLCFGSVTLHVANSIEGFSEFIKYLQGMEKEIEGNYE